MPREEKCSYIKGSIKKREDRKRQKKRNKGNEKTIKIAKI